MKYRLIAGTINRYPAEEGWENLHIDGSARGIWHGDLRISLNPEFVGDIAKMPHFREEMFDEIRLHHVLEHLGWERGAMACRELFRVLKPGGILDIEVPDLDRVIEEWVNGTSEKHGVGSLQQWIYGEELPHHEHWDSHRYGYTEDALREQLEAAGFEVGEREETGLALRFRAKKP